MVTSSQLYTVNLIQITAPWRGKGNGNPLRYSCLENPVDRGAWWAAVHRVAQSQTRLKRLSMQACFGEGNGNPHQYSCLENPRDRGAWWAAVYGISQSETRLKWLSSSSSPLEVSPVPRAKSCLGLSPSEWAGPASTQLVPLQEGSAITFGPQTSRVPPAPFLPARQGFLHSTILSLSHAYFYAHVYCWFHLLSPTVPAPRGQGQHPFWSPHREPAPAHQASESGTLRHICGRINKMTRPAFYHFASGAAPCWDPKTFSPPHQSRKTEQQGPEGQTGQPAGRMSSQGFTQQLFQAIEKV